MVEEIRTKRLRILIPEYDQSNEPQVTRVNLLHVSLVTVVTVNHVGHQGAAAQVPIPTCGRRLQATVSAETEVCIRVAVVPAAKARWNL